MTGRWLRLKAVGEDERYAGAFTERQLRDLTGQRKIAFSRVGKHIVLNTADLDAYLESRRVDPAATPIRRAVAT
jgi:hypothetical protein